MDANLPGCAAAPRFALLALVSILFPVSPLLAQAPGADEAGGLWWSVSAAVAGARLACDICDPSRDGGPSVEVAAGTYASDPLRVGLEAGAWTFSDGGFREWVYMAGVVAELHPRPGSGLHLIGGLGWSGYRAGDEGPFVPEDGFRYDGVRLRLGAGWDLPFTGAWVVGNRLTVDASSFGTLHDDDAPIARSVGLSVVRFGVHVRRR